MAVQHAKQVAVGRFIEVGLKHKAVLIHFVRIIRNKANPRGKRVLCHHVAFDIEG